MISIAPHSASLDPNLKTIAARSLQKIREGKINFEQALKIQLEGAETF